VVSIDNSSPVTRSWQITATAPAQAEEKGHSQPPIPATTTATPATSTVKPTNKDGIQMIISMTLPRTWDEKSRYRWREQLEVVSMNYALPHIANIHVLTEDPRCIDELRTALVESSKLVPVMRKTQALYNEIFTYANGILERMPGSTVMFANSDILFDDTLMCADRIIRNAMANPKYAGKTILSLARRLPTRCPVAAGGVPWKHERFDLCEQRTTSVDTWIIRSPVPPNILNTLKFKPNQWAADPNAVGRFKAGGWLTFNPCDDVHSYHMHCKPGERSRAMDQEMRKMPSAKSTFVIPAPMKVDCPAMVATFRIPNLSWPDGAGVTKTRLPPPTLILALGGLYER
jgi:hypothetical protein